MFRDPRVLVVLLLAAVVSAQDAPPTFRSEAQVVLLDVIATDGKGRPVDDLRPDELQVTEDGKVCEIRSFRLVRAGPRPASTVSTPRTLGEKAREGASPATPPTPMRPSLVVLVFDRLTTATAPLARKGALDLLAGEFPPDTWFAVFKVGYGVRMLASFTTDRVELQAAVEGATLGDADKTALAAPVSHLALTPVLPPRGAGSEAAVVPGLREVVTRLEDEEWHLLRRVQGLDSLYAVLGIARALGAVEGRKAVVYFAEAWHLPTDTTPAYDEAVSEANRANVAVHTVDARGLTAHKPMGLTPMDSVLDAFTADNREGPGVGAYTPAPEAGGGDGGPGGQTGGFTPKPLPGDARERLSGPRLERLAEDTGGLAIASTNDLGAGLARVAQELRQYYEIAYVPANPVADGRFRHIGVKVSRPGVHLRTRSGYFATPDRAATLAAYELPLMDALGAETPARSFALRTGVLHFAPRGGERECVVFAEVPLAEVQIASDEPAASYRAHLALLGYVKDEAGRVVARLTHDWPIEGPLREKEHARAQSAVFRRSMPLPPGRYVLEVAVQDQRSGGTSVTRRRFDVPRAGPVVSLGSVCLLQSTSAAPPVTPTVDPLRVGEASLVPRLGAPFEAGSIPELPLYAPIYPAVAGGPPELGVEVRRDGQVVAQASPALPAAEADGRIPWIGSIPAGELRPGTYEIVVTARQAGATVEERTRLEVVPGRQAATVPAETPTPLDPLLVPVLERAARYVVAYEEAFRNVVAEEAYTQDSEVPGSTRVNAWTPSGRTVTSTVRQHRVTRADLVFVRLAGDVPWGLFRDVFEVNGTKVRDRDERLERLFRTPSPSSLEQARRILEESARYNIGTAARTLNVPTLPLAFLHARNQSRFTFEPGGRRRIAGFEGLEVRFEEIARPTIVTDATGGDLPARGRFWIDPSRGTVLRSEVVFRVEPRRAEGSIEVEYRSQPRLGMFVPSEMKERYEDLLGTTRPVFGAPMQATARYSNFRLFTVTVEDEKAALPR